MKQDPSLGRGEDKGCKLRIILEGSSVYLCIINLHQNCPALCCPCHRNAFRLRSPNIRMARSFTSVPSLLPSRCAHRFSFSYWLLPYPMFPVNFHSSFKAQLRYPLTQKLSMTSSPNSMDVLPISSQNILKFP